MFFAMIFLCVFDEGSNVEVKPDSMTNSVPVALGVKELPRTGQEHSPFRVPKN